MKPTRYDPGPDPFAHDIANHEQRRTFAVGADEMKIPANSAYRLGRNQDPETWAGGLATEKVLLIGACYFNVRIGEDLFAEIERNVIDRGECVVLIAPRYGGKSWTHLAVRRRIRKRGYPTVSFRVLDEDYSALDQIACNADGNETTDPLGQAAELWEKQQKPPVILGANTLRTPTFGLGKALTAVGSVVLPNAYLEGLERAYQHLTGHFHRRPDIPGRIPVDILHVPHVVGHNWPFFLASPPGPMILLPARTSEPSMANALQRASAEACHETTHRFNWEVKSGMKMAGQSLAWNWFDEATAVYTEMEVFPGCLDYLHYAMDWCDHPGVPLDDPSRIYQAFMFALYLSRRYGPGFTSEIWEYNRSQEIKKPGTPRPGTPLDVLDAILKQRDLPGTEESARNQCAIFSHYAMEAYFTGDPASFCFCPQVFFRYGSRAVEEVFDVRWPRHVSRQHHVDHLACHYYLIRAGHPVQGFRIRAPLDSRLAFSAAVVHEGARRGPVQTIRTEAFFHPSQMNPGDEIVVCVANRGVRSKRTNQAAHDDDVPYLLHIETA